jgi:hypothetical protein
MFAAEDFEKSITAAKRLFGRVVGNGRGCWEWSGADSGTGYGIVGWDGQKYRVHRLAYELTKGPIPDGLVIDHLCRNRRCCNPDHLEAVTQRENTRRWADAIKACPSGHPYTDGNRVLKKNGTRICRECHRQRSRATRDDEE